MNVPLVVVVASVPVTTVPLGSVTTILMLAALTALLNVARTVVAFDAVVAPFAGVIVDTVGAVSVVKDQAAGVMGVPRGLAAATVAVYFVLAESNADGVNVTVVLVLTNAPATATPEAFTSVSVDLVGSTALVKVTWTVEGAVTPVALATGVRLAITGAGETVLNVHEKGAIAVPDALDAVTVAVYTVDSARAADGVNVADGAVTARVPGIAVPPGPVSVIDTDEGFSGPENVTVTGLVTATPDAPDAGVTDATDVRPAVTANTTSTK